MQRQIAKHTGHGSLHEVNGVNMNKDLILYVLCVREVNLSSRSNARFSGQSFHNQTKLGISIGFNSPSYVRAIYPHPSLTTPDCNHMRWWG